MGRAGAVLDARAFLPEHRRRHLQPFRRAGAALRARRRRQHDLQDPVQRRRGDDRRPAARRQSHGRHDRRAGARRRRRAHRGGFRRAREIQGYGKKRGRRRVSGRHDGAPSRRHGPGPARPARGQGRLGADLRPDLRGREAAPAQARRLSRSRQAGDHQRAGMRGLRRLRRAVQLRVGAAGGDRIRPQAPHRPVELQQGFFLRQRLLPVLRHRARGARSARRRGSPAPATRCMASPSRPRSRSTAAGRRSSTASAAPAW